MTDDELEQSLRALYRGMDPRHAPRGLSARIGDVLEGRPGRPVLTARHVPAFAAALAAMLIVAVGLGLRPGGFLSSTVTSPGTVASAESGSPATSVSPSAAPSASPRPSAAVSPTPSAAESASLSPSPTPAPQSLPSGSVPPVSSVLWSNLDVRPLTGGPFGVSSVTAWSGGYLALGRPNYPAPLPAWVSRDGRSWVALPAGTFGPVASVQAARCGDGLLVATQGYTGDTTIWRSTDGATWTSNSAASMSFAGYDTLAGNASGAVAILSETGLAFGRNGRNWQTVSLPGGTAMDVVSVAAFGSGFVAVGATGTTPGSESPAAWWSTDGLHWTRATIQADPGAGFIDVQTGASGLAAMTHSGGVPGTSSFWTSRDGRSWTISQADPLGTIGTGEGMGGVNGLFSGDGTRLLGYGTITDTGPTEYWISLDGTHWTKLSLAGDTATAEAAGGVTPFLLRDGILFSGDKQSWFGAAVT